MIGLRRNAIVEAARRWIGTPYQHQASLNQIGCDCLGLIRGVWREVVGPEPEDPPPYTSDWAEANGLESLAAAAHRHFDAIDPSGFREGDVLLFRFRDHLPAKHLAIATSATHMIHAHAGASVAEVAICERWRRQLAGAFAFPCVED